MFDPQPANESPARTSSPSSADLGRVRAVIDALPEAVFVTESDGDLRLTNPAADRLFANRPIVDRSDLLARFEEIDAKPGRAGRIASLAEDTQGHLTVRPRDQPNRLFTLRTVDLDAGRPGLMAVRGADPDQDESAAGRTVFVLRDVTESRDLRPVREAFLAVLSHELRTPITTIYAGSSVLARRPGLSQSATQTLAADISAEAARLYDLVEDLLVLARLERRVLDPLDEPVLVRRSVDSTIRMIAHRLGDVAIERTGDADVPPVHGDATYVDHACRNLLMASIRYAGLEPGRQLVVDIRVDPGAREVSVRILDRGPSLSDDELDHAFELPNGSAAGRLAGAGVGPFVARHLVEAMGGRVWTRGRPGGGLETGFALAIDERA
jgi:two-component system phosphate regulon sensor histidine kinase PhoR